MQYNLKCRLGILYHIYALFIHNIVTLLDHSRGVDLNTFISIKLDNFKSLGI